MSHKDLELRVHRASCLARCRRRGEGQLGEKDYGFVALWATLVGRLPENLRGEESACSGFDLGQISY